MLGRTWVLEASQNTEGSILSPINLLYIAKILLPRTPTLSHPSSIWNKDQQLPTDGFPHLQQPDKAGEQESMIFSVRNLTKYVTYLGSS